MSDFSNPNWFSDSQGNNNNNGQGSGSPIDNPNYLNQGSNDAGQQQQYQQYQQSPAQPDFLQSWQPQQNQGQPSYNTMPTPQTDQGNYGNPSYNPYQGQQANQWSGPSLNQMLPPMQPQHQQYQAPYQAQHQFPVPQPAQWGDTLNGMMQQWQPPHQQQNQQAMLGQGYNQVAQQTNNPNLMAWQHPSAWTRPGTQFNVYGNGENPSFTEFNANGGGPTSETDPNGAFGKGGWNIPRSDLTGMSEEQAKQLAIQAGQRDSNTDFQVFNTGNGFNIATRGRTPGQGMPGTGLLPMPRVAPSMPAPGGYRAPLPARGYSGGVGGGGYAPRVAPAQIPAGNTGGLELPGANGDKWWLDQPVNPGGGAPTSGPGAYVTARNPDGTPGRIGVIQPNGSIKPITGPTPGNLEGYGDSAFGLAGLRGAGDNYYRGELTPPSNYVAPSPLPYVVAPPDVGWHPAISEAAQAEDQRLALYRAALARATAGLVGNPNPGAIAWGNVADNAASANTQQDFYDPYQQ